MAKGKLTNIEKYAIVGMLEDDHSFEDIANEIGRSPRTVENYVKSIEAEEEVVAEDTKEKGKNKSLFVRKTAGQQHDGVSIMTESESARGEVKKGKSQSKISRRLRKVIHQISDDD